MRKAGLWNVNDLTAFVDEFVRAVAIPTTEPLSIYFASVKAGFDSGAHFHMYDQWVLALSGTATMTCGGEDLELKPGSIMLIPAGMSHSMRVHTNYQGFEFGLGRDVRDRASGQEAGPPETAVRLH